MQNLVSLNSSGGVVFAPSALVQPLIGVLVAAVCTGVGLFVVWCLIRGAFLVIRGDRAPQPYEYTDADFDAQWAELESQRIYGIEWGHEGNHASERNFHEMVHDDGKLGPGF